jgi:hypothetical protein
MAFAARDLSVLAYANGFTLWHFTTPDAVVTGAGYFNGAADMLRVGDIVVANINTAVTLATKIYTVTSNANGVVAVTVYA